jgi:hypothetical protein
MEIAEIRLFTIQKQYREKEIEWKINELIREINSLRRTVADLLEKKVD